MISSIANTNSIALDPQKIVAGVRKETKEAANELSQFADAIAMTKAGNMLGMLDELNESHEALFENMNTYKKLSAAKALEEGIENVKKNAEELNQQDNSSIEANAHNIAENSSNLSQNKTEIELAQTEIQNPENVQIEVLGEEVDMQEILLMEDVTAEAMEEMLDLYV